MARDLPVRPDWQAQVVATKTPAGPVYVLIDLEKASCEDCRYGIRFDTVWASGAGEGMRMAWCESCFNAHTERVELDEPHRALAQVAHQSVPPSEVHCWNGARPAVEDLERRGLL
jgi:hypothetical protein